MDLDINKFIGLPYEHRGRSYDGCDCYGIVQLFYRDLFGIEVPDYVEFYRDDFDVKDVGATISHAIAHQKWAEVDEPKTGTLITFRVLGVVSHIGIYLEDGLFLHAFHGTESCVESIEDLTWSKRVARMYELEINGE